MEDSSVNSLSSPSSGAKDRPTATDPSSLSNRLPKSKRGVSRKHKRGSKTNRNQGGNSRGIFAGLVVLLIAAACAVAYPNISNLKRAPLVAVNTLCQYLNVQSPFALSESRGREGILRRRDTTGESLTPQPRLQDLTETQRRRMDPNVDNAYPELKHLKIRRRKWWEGFAEDVFDTQEPMVVTQTPAIKWKTHIWNEEYLASHFPTITVQTPPVSTTRLHSITKSFGEMEGDIKWKRPWKEAIIPGKVFFENSKLAYYFSHAKHFPTKLQQDIESVDFLGVGWLSVWEINMWMGTPTMTTPAHYDMLHNLYLQLMGRKRFVFFPPTDEDKLYLFPRLHPSDRQSQVDMDRLDFNAFPRFKNTTVMEVILNPGDVVYIPPFWFHQVSVVGNETSVSMSVHTEATPVGTSSVMQGHTYSIPIDLDWSLPKRLVTLEVYVVNLFPSGAEAMACIRSLYESRYAPLVHDEHVEGLTDILDAMYAKLPPKNERPSVPKELYMNLARKGLELRSILYRIPERQGRSIQLGNYIEDQICYFMGTEYVQAFLLFMLEREEEFSASMEEKAEELL